MTILNILGLLSFVFVVGFTWHAYTRTPTPGQSPRSSIIEAWINIVIGFSINFCMNFLLLPMVGADHMTGMQNFALGWIYTAVSIIRQYAIRRWFNRKIHAIATRLTQ